jgi:hypothetical protein
MDTRAKELVKRGNKLFERKSELDSLWQEIALQFYPERADFTTQRNIGEEFAEHLFEGSPVLARRDLGNAFSSMLRPRGQPWFRADVHDDELREASGVRDFLDMVTARMRKAMYATGASFVRATKEGDHDFAAFGNAVVSVEVNQTQSGLLYRNWHLRDCAWTENSEGAVDTMFRKCKMSARQIAQKFGETGLHANIKRALDKDPDKTFDIKHVRLPFDDYEFAKRPQGMRERPFTFASVYIDCEHNNVMREAGSYEFGYVVPRWQTANASPYGYSPAAMTSLCDARMLQTMARIVIEAGEKTVDPPMVATEEAVRGDLNLYAGGVTWVDREYDERLGPALQPIQMGKQVGLGVDLLERARQLMAEAWYLNKLTLPGQAKTAFETAQLVEEFVRAAIPLFEPMETSYNAPLLDMTAEIMIRMGGFGRPDDWPEALAGQELQFAFSNPLQDAIERNKVMQAQTTMGIVSMAAQADPSVVEDVDVREVMRDAVAGSGAPAKWLRDREEADARVQQMQEMQAQQAAVQQAGAVADVAARGGDAAQSIAGALGGQAM